MGGSLSLLKKSMAVFAAGALALLGLAACSDSTVQSTKKASADGPAAQEQTVNVGTLATEDFLPMWKAEKEKLFAKQGVKVKISVFSSAQELSAALAAKAIDGAMTDIPVAASLTKGGTPITLSWVTLGQTAKEGRFGIMVGPKSKVRDLKDLAGTPIGVGSGTMLEYVMDRLMLNAGVEKSQIMKEEMKKLPVRFQLVMQGEAEAGVFPASLLALGELQGAKVIAEDTAGENLSQSVMAFRSDFVKDPAGQKAVKGLRAAWDAAVKQINANPEMQRELMVANTKLADPLKATYPVPHYPTAARPQAESVKSVLEWMKEKGYADSLSYDPKSGALKKA